MRPAKQLLILLYTTEAGDRGDKPSQYKGSELRCLAVAAAAAAAL